MKNQTIISITLLIWGITSSLSVFAENSDIEHSIGINIRPSYIIPTHGFYNGWNTMGKALRTGSSFHADYSFSYSPESRIGQIYPGAYQGIGVGVQTFLAVGLLGTPCSLYLFQGSPIARITRKLSLDYEWNFGISGGWKPESSEMLIASCFNAYINVGLFLKWRLGSKWDLQAGPEYTHYSNGDTKFPNGGANTFNFRIGVRRTFHRSVSEFISPEIFVFNKERMNRRDYLTYDLTIFGAWRADRMIVGNSLQIINKAFPLGGLQVNPLYHFNSSLSAGASIDFMFDRSSNLIVHEDESCDFKYSYPDLIRQCALGLSLRGELHMPIFAVNIGFGYNLCSAESDLHGIYTCFALKTFITDSLYINVGYRLGTVLYAHNLMFGLGWRFFNQRRQEGER